MTTVIDKRPPSVQGLMDQHGLKDIECAGCRKCCEGDTVALTEGKDNPADYLITRDGRGWPLLAKGEDGNCVYLGPTGCTIHDRKPYQCRILDCRVYAIFKRGSGEEHSHRVKVIAQGEQLLAKSARKRHFTVVRS